MCWLMACSQTIPSGEEVWLDSDGNVLPKRWTGVPKNPAPHHPLCAEKRRAALAEAPALAPPPAFPEGVNLEPPGASSVGGGPAPAAPKPKKPDQLKLF